MRTLSERFYDLADDWWFRLRLLVKVVDEGGRIKSDFFMTTPSLLIPPSAIAPSQTTASRINPDTYIWFSSSLQFWNPNLIWECSSPLKCDWCTLHAVILGWCSSRHGELGFSKKYLVWRQAKGSWRCSHNWCNLCNSHAPRVEEQHHPKTSLFAFDVF